MKGNSGLVARACAAVLLGAVGLADCGPALAASTFWEQTQLSEFAGPYVGIKGGVNQSTEGGAQSGPEHYTGFPGVMAGWGFMFDQVLVAPEVFADFHHGSYTYKDGGLDLKIGVPFSRWMPYGRIGATGWWPQVRFHGGAGLEWTFRPSWSANVEWTADVSNSQGTHRANNSWTVGLMYHFY